MFPRKYKKLSSFKRFILKLLDVYALDRETLNLVNPNYNNSGNNFFKLNEKSIILSNGYLKLDRKINKLDIFYRYAPNNSMWNSSERWKRIIPNITKRDLILTSLTSLKKSLLNFLNENDIEISIYLISDVSDVIFDKQIQRIFEKTQINTKFISSKIKGNRGSYLECCDQAENSNDLIFFIEDDYIFEDNCIEEMIISYSRISTLMNKDVFLCPSDYPFYYDSSYLTSVYLGKNFKWRIVYETLLTFLMSKELFNKHKNNIRLVGEQDNNPFEKPLHSVYKEDVCLAPVNSLSYHISKDHPSTTQKWIDVWNDNFVSNKN
tara:strand:- start:328 stop:1290 length:963 start_codon:yes stop_codon:yes gene_type:complete